MTANILVVEDDADINEIISTQLSRNGHTCTQAFSGTEALMRLDPNGGPLPYDLVICDLMLPRGHGRANHRQRAGNRFRAARDRHIGEDLDRRPR